MSNTPLQCRRAVTLDTSLPFWCGDGEKRVKILEKDVAAVKKIIESSNTSQDTTEGVSNNEKEIHSTPANGDQNDEDTETMHEESDETPATSNEFDYKNEKDMSRVNGIRQNIQNRQDDLKLTVSQTEKAFDEKTSNERMNHNFHIHTLQKEVSELESLKKEISDYIQTNTQVDDSSDLHTDVHKFGSRLPTIKETLNAMNSSSASQYCVNVIR